MKKSILKIYTDEVGNYYIESLDGNVIPINVGKCINYEDFIKNNELSLSYEDKMDIPPSLTHIVKEIDPMYQMVVTITC